MTDDPTTLCSDLLPGADIAAIDWLTATPGAGAGITDQWLGTQGEVLTRFAAVRGEPADLLAADLAALLAGGSFVPGDPLLEGHRIRGATTDRASAGAGLLDIATYAVDGGAGRVVLQRPAGRVVPGTAPSDAAPFTVDDLVALVARADEHDR